MSSSGSCGPRNENTYVPEIVGKHDGVVIALLSRRVPQFGDELDICSGSADSATEMAHVRCCIAGMSFATGRGVCSDTRVRVRFYVVMSESSVGRQADAHYASGKR